MGLVDYSSSSSGSEPEPEPGSRGRPAKRRRASPETEATPRKTRKKNDEDGGKTHANGSQTNGTTGASDPDLPPLPDEFHDLYASTVRHSVVDDPSLHQGRKRLIPHVVGNWPSHLYIEWHPTTKEHTLLTALLAAVRQELGPSIPITSFLTSDLNAPLPLHISLSRPIVLTTAQRDRFLEQVGRAVALSSVHRFSLSPHGLGWYRSPDSNRSFLVLRVSHGATRVEPPTAHLVEKDRKILAPANKELVRLLTRLNSVVAAVGQPPLYQKSASRLVEEAFHISIAWAFSLPDEELCLKTYALLKREPFREIARWRIPVGGIKVKIGNVVTHVPLPEKGRTGDHGQEDGSVFEI